MKGKGLPSVFVGGGIFDCEGEVGQLSVLVEELEQGFKGSEVRSVSDTLEFNAMVFFFSIDFYFVAFVNR